MMPEIRSLRSHRGYALILEIFFLLFVLFFTGSRDTHALSIEDEKKLGREFMENIRRQYELVDDDFAVDYINDLGSYLVKPLETKHFPFHFYIIKSSELNAFAAPAGNIFLFTGLIETMDKIDELAAVISHEVGHVSARHLSERLEQSKTIGLATLAAILAGSLLGGAVAEAIITGSIAAGVQTQLGFSRNDERQADQLSIRYMNETGFDPAGMIRALSKIQRSGLTGTDKVPPYLLTHPGAPERMANIESMLSSYTPGGPKEEAERLRRSYPMFRTVLRGRYWEPHAAEKHFHSQLEKNPLSPQAHFGLGIMRKEEAAYHEAIEHFQKALEGLPDSLPVLRYLGEVYQLLGRDQEALKIFEKALKIDNMDRSTLFLAAMSYQNMEDYPRANRIFERLVSMEPVQDKIFYHFGVSLGRQERYGLAHYYFGVYFKKKSNIKKADFHFQKAREFAGSDPGLMERIRKAEEKD